MKTLNPEVLKEIAIETRQCFLNEDAPSYLANLQKGLAQIQAGNPDYVFLMHAAHSLKGGSAIAELSSLSKLAHKLEDILEILQHNELCDRRMITDVFSHGVDEVASVLSQASGLPHNILADIDIDAKFLDGLDTLLESFKGKDLINPLTNNSDFNSINQFAQNGVPALALDSNAPQKTTISPLIRSALEKDLETCIQQVESQLLANNSVLSISKIKEELQYFCDECLLLGDTLNLTWLIDTVEPFETSIQQSLAIDALLAETQEIIKSLRSQSSQYLNPELNSKLNLELNLDFEFSDSSKDFLPIASTANTDNQPIDTKPISEEDNNPIQILPPPTAKAIAASTSEVISYLRIPSAQMESMTNTVAEMILRHERLVQQQQQLGRTNKNLQSLVLQMIPLQEQVQTIYDALAINETAKQPLGGLEDHDDFDELELDQYSSSHTTLQNLQEVLLRVRESRSDIDLSYRDLGEEIEYLRQDLDRLYAQLTQSRLVPFKTLASRFVPQLKRLCHRYHKQVELVIQGEEVPIDQVILEQLQTPLNHLLVNAFDHGVESPETRLSLGKSAKATLTLSAIVAGNQVIISLKDDGDGIDLEKVYGRAVERNICPPDTSIESISRQEILNFIFQPHFSTKDVVSDISGRGMGLDIVRSQINRLRGNIQVDTTQGQGTTFTIRLPLGLSLVTLLICAIGENLIAIPANDVLDIFPYAEAQIQKENNSTKILWRKQMISLLHLKQALNYARQTKEQTNPKVCLVLNRTDIAIAVAIDMIIEERQLILKPFDRSVEIPSYLTGCTILGTGQVVPVLTPDNLHLLLPENIIKKKKETKSTNQSTNQLDNNPVKPTLTPKLTKSILIAEDSIATRNMLERLLKQLDFDVIACRDGQEAIEALNRNQSNISMVISDIEMPRANGFDLLQSIRASDRWSTLPVVMLTSRTGDRHRQKAISLGANGYLSKPIVVGELINCLNSLA
ncbi:response regulator [Pseudanabaena sp. FACHB-1998]|uniref:hybrid sensor histidine kinase/response regulator n=1 Tax=Pseudanabaena sp. FACHB-1998 TaxID=2692858 RepID=UPI00168050A7|nr:hybrid sensor histidine kinase/response regulator [Pseudanabaena sp. FACHB-1998]MBD2178944.1 response regulator [Pseudanabaena sp. FACHB-1998]